MLLLPLSVSLTSIVLAYQLLSLLARGLDSRSFQSLV
jgi:hypothetical protein